jgi:Tfp pilus assembly protein PilX
MKRQQGSSLLLVLIVLGVMLAGALAAVRSTDTASQIAGNAAFRSAARQSADVGASAAFAYLTANAAVDTSVPNLYYPIRGTDDAAGLPAIAWGSVAATTVGNNTVQWVVERMCRGALPVTDPQGQCLVDVQTAAGSNKIGADAFSTPANVFYRITIRVRGPKNTESFAQTLVSR